MKGILLRLSLIHTGCVQIFLIDQARYMPFLLVRYRNCAGLLVWLSKTRTYGLRHEQSTNYLFISASYNFLLNSAVTAVRQWEGPTISRGELRGSSALTVVCQKMFIMDGNTCTIVLARRGILSRILRQVKLLSVESRRAGIDDSFGDKRTR